MLTLAIQSAFPQVEIALIQGNEVIYQNTWESKRDEISKLLPAISEALSQTHHQFSDLKRMVVVNGPGAFSSTRIGVTIANSLGYALHAEIYEITAETYQKLLEGSSSQVPAVPSKHLAQTSLAQVVLQYFSSSPQPVPLAVPKYSSEAKITPSKKPKFV